MKLKLDNIDLDNIDEKWFSDRLELLLTTKGVKGGLRVNFARKFIQRVYGKDKKPNVQNSLTIREYPVNIAKSSTKFIDLLYLDLDSKDNVVIGVENKFLTEDSKGQIEEYKQALKELYKDFDTKIVYLTLDGREPKNYEAKEGDIVCLSWIDDILEMLLESIYEKLEKEHHDFDSIDEMLKKWYRRKTKNKINPQIKELIEALEKIREIKNIKDANSQSSDDEIKNADVETKKADDQVQTADAKIKEFILNQLEGCGLHQPEINIQVSYIGKCYRLYHKPKPKIQMFVPVTENMDQFTHMLNVFCSNVRKKYKKCEKYEETDTNNIKLEVNNIAKSAICRYLHDGSKLCNKKDIEDTKNG